VAAVGTLGGTVKGVFNSTNTSFTAQ